ncbi:MAG: CDP-diacylglycerol--glycerol-3-phosphate 3-phosphatidyltransferase, partial [Deltaproteobacteria bacterium]|nr:CDP-diacylglycerol--glycerol-3-phosphate 3-phosphatidyltransferase [Deltaproteobacteria bacterium]
NLPNYLTLGRIVLIPVVLMLLAEIDPLIESQSNFWYGLLAALIFIIAGVSDLVDGYYARKYKINSAFGKYFDPLADKLMVLTVMIMLMDLDRLAPWVVILFLMREVSITALRGVASAEGLTMAADQWGKKKTLLQNIALPGLMLNRDTFLGFFDPRVFGEVILYAALIVAVASGLHYLYRFSLLVLRKT